METDGKAGFPIETYFTRESIERMIDILWKKRWNRHLGMKFAIMYLEKYGREGEEKLKEIGINFAEIRQKYEEHKSLYGVS